MVMTKIVGRGRAQKVWCRVMTLAAFISGIPTAVRAQTATTTNPDVAQTILYGVCSYNADGTYYHTGIFSAAMTLTGQIQRQFVQYSATEATKARKLRVGCHWALTQQEISKGLQLIEQSASTKHETISWQYNAAALQTWPPHTAQRGATGVPTADPMAGNPVTATARSNVNGASAPGVVATGSPSGTVNPAGQPGSSTSGSGLSSIATSTQQTMKDAQTNATGAVATSLNSATTSAVNDMTNAATAAVTNVFKRKKKAVDGTKTDQITPANGVTSPPAVVATSAAAVVPVGPPAQSVPPASKVGTPNSAPVGFLFCHLQASGSEYYSDIFPAGVEDQGPATMAFWREVSHQYKLSKVPFSNNVACPRSPTDADAAAARQVMMTSATQRGIAGAHTVETGWAYMGESK